MTDTTPFGLGPELALQRTAGNQAVADLIEGQVLPEVIAEDD